MKFDSTTNVSTLQMRRRRLERLSNLPLRSNTAPTKAADTSAPMNESLSASVPDIVYTTGEVGGMVAMTTGEAANCKV